MRRNRGWTGARRIVAALWIIGLSAASSVQAAGLTPLSDKTSGVTPLSVNTYSTTVDIKEDVGVTGTNVIAFNPVASGSFKATSAFSLGEFVVSALADGTETTYNDTPFSIKYNALTVNGTAPTVNGGPLTITGKLNGVVEGADRSNVVATFDPVTVDPAFRTDDFLNTLKVGGSVLLVPSSTNGGRTTVQAVLSATYKPVVPTPEPTTIAIFMVAGIGLGLRHRLRARASE